MDVWGLRPFLILACWLNCLGAGVRILSAIEWIKAVPPFALAIVGQVVGK